MSGNHLRMRTKVREAGAATEPPPPFSADFDKNYRGLVEVDNLDTEIIAALRRDGRAPFSALGEQLGVSDQTVARRYRRLRADAGLRVVGLPNGVRLGYDMWLIRLQAAPDNATAIAEALARRPDTTWVSINSGGTEILAVVQNPGNTDRDALLLQKLPRTPRLVSVRAYGLMHLFSGGAVGTESDGTRGRATPPEAPPALLDSDAPLMAALRRDGRLGYPELAQATGLSESSVRRRVEALRSTGALFFDVEIDPAVLGYHARATLWLAVAPAHLAAVGDAIATHPEVRFAAATTGETNLVATVVFQDLAGLYDYLTQRIGPLPGVERIESAPSLRHVKQVGPRQPG
jgi:DNA-binding Lrp family transcriptional regulator